MAALLSDQHGVPISGSAEAVAVYDEAIDRLLRFHPDVVTHAGTLTTDHPDVAMGHALVAYLHLMSTDPADLATASSAAAILRERATHARELGHAAAVDSWLEGDWVGAAACLDDILQRWPTDLLALAIGHQLDFFLGNAANLRDRVSRTLMEVDPENPHVGFVQGMQSFGLEEAGHYRQAEDAGLTAVERNRDDVWAVHAVVHTYEMQGRVDDGLKFMLARENDWGTGNLFAVHVWWHLALFALEAGDRDRALATYDAQIHNEGSAGVPLEMLDASALLWRFVLDGVSTGDRFAALATAWVRASGGEPWYAFNDLHAVMAFVGSGRFDKARSLIERLEEYRDTATGTNARITAEVGLPAFRAVLAFGEDRYRDVIRELNPIRNVLHHMGGSHAQRDALQRTLLEAAIRAGEFDLARALTAERLNVRDCAYYNWVQRSRALRGLGLGDAADEAVLRGEEYRRRFAAVLS